MTFDWTGWGGLDLHLAATSLAGTLGVLGLVCGLPPMVRGLRDPERTDSALMLLAGARWFIVGLGCVGIAFGLALEAEALFWCGVAFAAEELYETTAALTILRWGRRRGYI